MIVKICGLTRPEDAAACVRAGADWLGLNLWPHSRRAVTPARARELAVAARAEAARAAASVTVVGVFVNQSEDEIAAAAAAAELDLVQLHGDEPAALCAGLRVRGLAVIKALGLRAEADLDRVRAYADALVDFLLVDAPSPGYGGAGRTGDWDLARAAVALGVAPVLLAGGLRPDNVAAAITAVGPAGVDVASGVEAGPGVKDDDLVRAFVRAARAPTPASG